MASLARAELRHSYRVNQKAIERGFQLCGKVTERSLAGERRGGGDNQVDRSPTNRRSSAAWFAESVDRGWANGGTTCLRRINVLPWFVPGWDSRMSIPFYGHDGVILRNRDVRIKSDRQAVYLVGLPIAVRSGADPLAISTPTRAGAPRHTTELVASCGIRGEILPEVTGV